MECVIVTLTLSNISFTKKKATIKQRLKNSNEKAQEFDASASLNSTQKTQSKKYIRNQS